MRAGESAPPHQALARAARVLFLAAPLSFLPVLAIPNLEDTAPFFALACLAGAAATVALGVKLVSQPLPALTRPVEAEGSGASAGRSAQPASSRSPISRSGFVLAWGLALAYAFFMSLLTVARHNSVLTNAFDLGIHDQAIYNILHSGYMRSTLYGTYAINYIGDHFSPILYLLAPVYALRQDARTLLILQSLFLAAGAIPLYLLARYKTRSVSLSLALASVYLLHPALHGVNLDDFHQIALVVVFLLAALYFLETGPQEGPWARRDVPFLVALALALIVKEEVALTVAAVGAYAFFGKQRYRLGAAVTLAGLAYFAIVVGWVMPHLGGTPQIDTRFGDYMAPGTDGASGIAWTLFTNPWFTVVHVFGNQAKLLFILQIFLPVLFLPLFAPAAAWLVALPALAVLLLTSAHTQYDIAYHYSAHLLPSVFFLAALATTRVVRKGPACTWAVAAALLVSGLGMSYLYGPILPKDGLQIPRPNSHDRVAAVSSTRFPVAVR